MQFPYSYFEDEVRDGFYVSGLMKRAWAAQIEVLCDIDRVCKKYNIQWFADCGTLLGAVRHGGFIPWDDDMDICMTRDNYMKFLAVAKKELPEGYDLLNFHNDDNYFEFLTRVVNGRKICFDREHLEKFHEFPFVVGIDIFPLDYLAPNSEEEECRKNVVQIVMGTADEITDENHLTAENERQIALVEEICRVTLDRNGSLKRQLYILAEQLFSLYGKDEAEEVALMPYWINEGNHNYPKSCFEQTVMIPFENIEISAPAMYDRVLKIEYGSYMKVVKGGGVHDYPFYKKQEEQLKRNFGIQLPKYNFSEVDIQREETRMRKEKIAEMTNLIKTLARAHEILRTAIGEQQYTEAMQLLGQCQEGAIGLGNAIEVLKGEGFRTVGMLEEYCERIYQIYEKLSQHGSVDAEGAYQSLQEILTWVEESVTKDIKERREVVFLPYKASMWDSLESVWKAADEDPTCDAYVVPIPYYDRKADGSFGEMHYEGDQYPDYVPITSYEKYRIEERLPDMIFIHNPYDECNYVTSVHPAFYSKNLKNYTETLVYIPYFILDEINPEDARTVQSMEHFVTVPGVVHADKVIVQSEQMRQIYIDTMTGLAGEQTRQIWEKKILGTGSPKVDKVLCTRKEEVEIPKEWQCIIKKTEGDQKKVILYNTSVSTLLQNEELMLKKLQNVFDFFKKYQSEVALLWRPHPLISTTIESMRPQLWEEYQKIVERYKEEKWGIYDDTADLDRAIAISDAYYGDGSSVVQLYRETGKPVLFEQV